MGLRGCHNLETGIGPVMKSIDAKSIKDFSIFNGLSDRDLKDVAAIVTRRDFESNSSIIAEGAVGDELYLLEEGVVDIHKTLTIVTSKHDFGTKERSFIRLTGEQHPFFGEMALFGSGERSATVNAVTTCKLLVIRKDDFRDLCEKQPRIGYVTVTNIALMLSNYLRKTNEDVIKLTTALSLALSGEG